MARDSHRAGVWCSPWTSKEANKLSKAKMKMFAVAKKWKWQWRMDSDEDEDDGAPVQLNNSETSLLLIT